MRSKATPIRGRYSASKLPAWSTMTTKAEKKTFLLSRYANLLNMIKNPERPITEARKHRILNEIGRILLKLESM